MPWHMSCRVCQNEEKSLTYYVVSNTYNCHDNDNILILIVFNSFYLLLFVYATTIILANVVST